MGILSAAGLSSAAGAREAGRAAAGQALAGLAGQTPALVLVYSSVRYDSGELLAAVRELTDAPLAGSTSAGHFTGCGGSPAVMGPGEGVMVLALAGGDYRFGVGSATGMAADPEAAGAAATRAARAAARSDGAEAAHSAVVLITDGLGGDQQAVLSGVHRVAGASVPVVGGAAGDDGRMNRVDLFHDDAVLSGGVVAVWVESPRPPAVGSAHGWSAISLPVLVTRSDGSVIHELGGRSAAEVYAELSSPAPEPGSRWQPSYALGLIEPDGSHLMRVVYADSGGVIRTLTRCPPTAPCR